MSYNVREYVAYVDADKRGINFLGWMEVFADEGHFLEPMSFRLISEKSVAGLPRIDRLVPRSGILNRNCTPDGAYATCGNVFLNEAL